MGTLMHGSKTADTQRRMSPDAPSGVLKRNVRPAEELADLALTDQDGNRFAWRGSGKVRDLHRLHELPGRLPDDDGELEDGERRRWAWPSRCRS
jgi:hypothetical protein